MNPKPLNRVEALYLRIHDTPDEQAYISIETSDAKCLSHYAYEKYALANQRLIALRAAENKLELAGMAATLDDMQEQVDAALAIVRKVLGNE